MRYTTDDVKELHRLLDAKCDECDELRAQLHACKVERDAALWQLREGCS